METLHKSFLAIHLIAVISWMAGLLYGYRLLVYHAEEKEAVVIERFKFMEKRLYSIITLPAMTLALLFGLLMVGFKPSLLRDFWLQAKFFLILLQAGVTVYCGRLIQQFAVGPQPLSGKKLRVLNELPTLILILIVFLAVLKPK